MPSGEALDWAAPLLEQNSPVLSGWDAFLPAFMAIFDDPHRICSTEAPSGGFASIRAGPATSYSTHL